MDDAAHERGVVWHAAMHYRALDELIVDMGGFAEAGVRAGDAVLVAAGGVALDRLRGRLGGQTDGVTWLDLSPLGSNPRRVMSGMRLFAEGHRGRPVRIARQAGWLTRPADEVREAMRYEPLLDLAVGPVRLLCAFDARLDAAVLDCAERTHRLVGRGGRWTPSRSYASSAQLPRECDSPLAPPPADAAVLTFRRDHARVRDFVAGRARAAGLDADRAADLILAVSELTANTHAHTSRPGTVTLWRTDAEIICQVHDSGHITDPLAGSLPPDLSATSKGWGLWVVNQVCDLVETRTAPGGTTTRVHMRLRHPPPARRPPASSDGGAREQPPLGNT